MANETDSSKIDSYALMGNPDATAEVVKLDSYVLIGPATTAGQGFVQIRYGGQAPRLPQSS